jgi:acyl carrier protein
MASISERVKKIIADKLVIDEAEITDNANFKKDLGADSIDLVELIMEFERAFDISIPDEQAEAILTVADAINFLESNITT